MNSLLLRELEAERNAQCGQGNHRLALLETSQIAMTLPNINLLALGLGYRVGTGDGLVMRSTCCPSREQGFGSQHPPT